MVPVQFLDSPPDGMGLHMDRPCDGCGSNANATVHLRSGRQLDLCDRHVRQYERSLRREGAVVVGDLQAMLTSPTVATGSVLELRRQTTAWKAEPGVSRSKRVWAWLTNTLAVDHNR